MSEGIRSNPTGQPLKRKLALMAAGTAVAVLATAVAIQMFRAEDGAAAPQSAPAADQAGTARVSGTDRPLARVNKQLITWEAVAQECMLRYGSEVLDNIINRTIIVEACEQRGISVTEQEVNAEIARIAKRFNLTIEQWFQMLKAERNITPDQYQRDIIWPMLALRKIAGDDVQITEQDIQQAFVRDYGPRVEARLIMLDNVRRAQEVYHLAQQNPDDFERLAQKHSIEPNSAAMGGAVPPIRRYSGNKELEEAAFKLKPGEISPIVQAGPSRYVILKCEGHTEPVVTLNEVRERIAEDLREEKTQVAVAGVFEQLKKETRVDNFLTNVSTGGVQQTSGTRAGDGVAPADLRLQPPYEIPRAARP